VNEARSRLANSRGMPAFVPIVVITLILFAVSAALAPGTVSRSGLDSTLPFAGILAIAAVGQAIVVMMGGIDLSLPGMMTLSAMVTSQFAAENGDNIWLALLVVGGIAVLSGAINGVLVVVFEVTPLIATLAMNAALLGVASAYSGGTPTSAPKRLTDFALAKTVGVSNTVWAAVVVVAIVGFIVSQTVWGRRLIAVGTNRRAARASGIRWRSISISGYVMAALCYSAAGVVLAGFVSSPRTDAGNPYLLPAIAAVVVGGTPLIGGKGTVIGAAVGAVFFSQLRQLVFALGAPSASQLLVQASVIGVAATLQVKGSGVTRRLAEIAPFKPRPSRVE
jgi:ribose transport system permease protein